MATHALLGANAALGAKGNPLMGVVNGLVLESVAHSRFSESLAGGGALAAGYGLLAVGNLASNFNQENMFDVAPDWFRRGVAEIQLALDKAKMGRRSFEIGETQPEGGLSYSEKQDIYQAWREDAPPTPTPTPTLPPEPRIPVRLPQ